LDGVWQFHFSFFALFATTSRACTFGEYHNIIPQLELYLMLQISFFGKHESTVTHVLLTGTLFFIMSSYLLVFALAIQDIFYESHICQTTASAIAMAILLIPSQIRTLHGVSFIGIFSTLAIVIVIGMCVGEMFDDGVKSHVEHYNVPKKLAFLDCLSALSAFVFGSGGQLIYLEMIAEMKKPEDFPKSFICGNIVMFIVYIFVMVVTYHFNGQDTPDFLLDVFHDGVKKRIANIFLALHVIVSYTLMQQVVSRQCHVIYTRYYLRHSSLVNHITRSHKHFAESTLQWFVLTVTFAVLAFVVANLVPFFLELVSLIGSMTLAPICYILPCLYYVRCAAMRGFKLQVYERGCVLALILFGLLLLTAGTYSNVKNIVDTWKDNKTPFSC
jgi:amino acid permease